jgi:hypothetical protein
MRANKAEAKDLEVQMARSPIGGKKTAKIEFRCSDDLKDELARRARDLGFSSESELAELLLAVGLFGKGHVAMVQQQRLERVVKLSDEEGGALS